MSGREENKIKSTKRKDLKKRIFTSNGNNPFIIMKNIYRKLYPEELETLLGIDLMMMMMMMENNPLFFYFSFLSFNIWLICNDVDDFVE